MSDELNKSPKISVLVVDDEEDLLMMVCQAVRSKGMTVKGITNGRELAPSLLADPFDVILMDICIGPLDGRELTRELKADKRFSYIPVLLYSAKHMEENPMESCGADAFLAKPFDITKLVTLLQDLAVSPAC